MESLKKNYEKVLLALVLLGLTGVVVWLLIIIPEKRQRLQDLRERKLSTRIEPLPPLDMAPESAALKRANTPVRLDFTTKHNLLNPVVWQRTTDGRLIKVQTGNEIGPGALEIVAIHDLFLRVVFDSPQANGYLMRITDEAATRKQDREATTIISTDRPNDTLTLKKIGGPPDRPTELEIVMRKTGETIVVRPEKPFERVDGHTADLKYPPDLSLPGWQNARKGDTLRFGGAEYNIVDVDENAVVVLAKSNNKRTTIYFRPTTDKH